MRRTSDALIKTCPLCGKPISVRKRLGGISSLTCDKCKADVYACRFIDVKQPLHDTGIYSVEMKSSEDMLYCSTAKNGYRSDGSSDRTLIKVAVELYDVENRYEDYTFYVSHTLDLGRKATFEDFEKCAAAGYHAVEAMNELPYNEVFGEECRKLLEEHLKQYSRI